MSRTGLYLCLAASAVGSLVACTAALVRIPEVTALDRSDKLVEEAQARAAQGDADGSRKAVDEALALAPENPRARRELGMHMIAARDLEGAARELLAVARARSGDAGAARELASVLGAAGDAESAVKWLRRALRIAPADAISRALLVGYLVKLDRIPEAREEAEIAAKLAPQVPDVQSRLGIARWKDGDRAGAELAFKRALELWPSDLRVTLFLGAVVAEQNRPEESAQYLLRVIALDPQNVTAYVGLGSDLLSLNLPDEAEAAFRKALELDPGNELAEMGLQKLEELFARPERASPSPGSH